MRPVRIALLVSLSAVLVAMLPDTSVAASVTLTNPAEGATVSGIVSLAADAGPGTLSVDFSWSVDGTVWVPIATDVTVADGWGASWSTAPYDGPAIVRAVADDGLGTAEDQNAVTVDNIPPGLTLGVSPAAFSPNGDGRRDATRITIGTDEPATVVVRVQEGAVVHRTWTRNLGAGGSASIDWDGRNSANELLPDRGYVIAATATDAVGFTDESTAPVIIDTHAPSIAWRSINPEPAGGKKPLRFAFQTADRATVLGITLEVRDAIGTVRSRTETGAPGNRTISWQPRYAGGGRLYPGTHRARLVVSDDAGNIARHTRTFRVKRKVKAHVFRRVKGAGRRVAITIDDCHFADAWKSMLDTLEQMNAKATFFCPGDRMLIFPGLLQRTVEEGHALGAHGWDHAAFKGMSFRAAARRLRKDARTAWSVARVTTAPYFRPPYGSYDRSTVRAAGKTGHGRIIMWDVETGDTGGAGTSAIRHRAVHGARRGSIILMHTLDQTAAALPGIISGLRKKGLKLVTLPALFRAGGYR